MFFWIAIGRKPQRDEGEIFLYPAPTRQKRQPIEGMDKVAIFGERHLRIYESALEAYNNGQWLVFPMAARLFLEALLKALLPSEEHDSLHKMLTVLPKHVKLDKPILDLGHSIRKGGNIAAHFDPDREIDQTSAEMIMELFDDLIKYLLLIPQRIEELQEQLEGTEKDSEVEDA